MKLEDKQWAWANLVDLAQLAASGDEWASSLIGALLDDLLAP